VLTQRRLDTNYTNTYKNLYVPTDFMRKNTFDNLLLN